MDQYRPLQAVAYERLRDMIQDGEFAFDAIYSETRLAAQFSISRTPMRDALIRLKNEGYIDILPNRGFCLHKPTRKDIIDAYHVRASIESHCAALIAREHASDSARETIAAMQDCARQQRDLCDCSDMDLRDFWKKDVQFHGLIVDYPGVAAFRQQFDSVMHFFAAHCVRAYRSKGRDQTTLDEHEKLISALECGDESAVRSAVQRHMDETLRITLQGMDEQGEEN